MVRRAGFSGLPRKAVPGPKTECQPNPSGLAEHITAREQRRERLRLNGRRRFIAKLVQDLEKRRLDAEGFEGGGGHGETLRRIAERRPMTWLRHDLRPVRTCGPS